MDDIYCQRGLFDSHRIIERIEQIGDIEKDAEENSEISDAELKELRTKMMYEKMLQSIKLQYSGFGY